MKLIIRITIIVLLILAGVFIYSFFFDNSTDPSVEYKKDKISIPEEYVSLKENDANKAVFVFNVPVKKEDMLGSNIKYCIISVSAGAQEEGRQPECAEASPNNGFTLEYIESSKTLTIKNISLDDWGAINGPFMLGCAACASAVEFSNIRTSDDQILPKKIITVY